MANKQFILSKATKLAQLGVEVAHKGMLGTLDVAIKELELLDNADDNALFVRVYAETAIRNLLNMTVALALAIPDRDYVFQPDLATWLQKAFDEEFVNASQQSAQINADMSREN